jgi:nitroreductase
MSDIPQASVRDVKEARPEHPVLSVIAQRWSPRSFANRPVEPEKLRQVLEAARWAPSSYNEQPWRFLIAMKDAPEAYAQMLGVLNEKNQRWAQQAPVLMLTVAKRTFSRNGKPNRHAWHDVGLAMGNLLAQATALDLYVHQMAGIHPEKAREVYAIPEDFGVVAGAAIGYLGAPDDLPESFRNSETKARSRRALPQTVFEGTWGETAALVADEDHA